MEIIYYIVIVTILAFSLPLASRGVTYAPNGRLRGRTEFFHVSQQQQMVLIAGAVIITCALILLCLIKPEDIADNQMYLKYYDLGGGEKARRGLEPTFAMIVKIAPTFAWLIGIYALLSVSGHIAGIFWNSPNIWLSLLIYLTYTFILHDMIQIRAAVGIGFMLVAVRFIQERKWWLYFPLVLVGFFFHYSLSVFFILYFIPYRRLNKWWWASILVLAFLLGIMDYGVGYLSKYLPLSFIEEYIYRYGGNKAFMRAEIGPMRALKVVAALIMLFNLEKIKKEYVLAVPVLVLFMLSQISYLLLMDMPVLQGRLGEMLGAFDIFAWAMFPFVSKKHYYLLFIVPIVFMIYDHLNGYILMTTISPKL